MNVNQREEVIKLYPHSEKWKEKVKKMDDAQVSAIYIRAKNEGRLGK